MSTPVEIIVEAIRNKRLIAFNYHGGPRVVEPHTFGIDRWGRETLCGFQIEGISRSAHPQGWKFFRLAEISQLRAEAQQFRSPRPEYQRGDGAFAQILAEL